MFIILASVNSVCAAPGGGRGQTYYVNGYVKSYANGIPLSGATVDLYVDNQYIYTVTTLSNGFFSGSAYLETLPRFWKVVVNKPLYHSETVTKTANIEGPTNMGTIYLIPIITQGERIGVFFWASDCRTQANIDEYKGVLQNEGYTKFFDFKDSTDFAADLANVSAYEDADDIIFFYITGHGLTPPLPNVPPEWISATRLTPDYYGTFYYADDFRTYCDGLDSTRIGLLVESCYSGSWASDMEGGGYLAISSSDIDEESMGGYLPGEGYFSNAFFYYVSIGYTAVQAFEAAKTVIPQPQTPQICDESSNNFFA